jgi:hypothetical protein
MNKEAKKLADLIEANPNCKFEIDNDNWCMVNKDGEEIINSDSFGWYTDWYSDSSNYGFGIAEALVILLNRKGFKITAEAV